MKPLQFRPFEELLLPCRNAAHVIRRVNHAGFDYSKLDDVYLHRLVI